ncbi:tetratricopeptide repeat protein [Myxococcota bacterium]|nr:tetratricopeptide repeat protein [Myxococcota bacterium]
MASIHLDRGEGARALAVLSGLAGLRPDDPVLLRERAELALSLGRPDEAARALDEAPEAIQGTVPVGRLRARIAQELERPAEAERWLARVAAAAPDDAEARLDLGSLARRRGAPGEAEGWYWEALAVGAGPDARVGLMQLMADQGRYPEALALNREIAAQRPGEARWARWEAWLLLASGESDRAAAAYTALSRASPGDPEARLGRCRALLAAKEARAVDACREAARSPGADARAWVALGEALHAQGRSGEAREAATKAVALDPDLPDGYRLLERSLPEGSAEAKLAAARARTRGE